MLVERAHDQRHLYCAATHRPVHQRMPSTTRPTVLDARHEPIRSCPGTASKAAGHTQQRTLTGRSVCSAALTYCSAAQGTRCSTVKQPSNRARLPACGTRRAARRSRARSERSAPDTRVRLERIGLGKVADHLLETVGGGHAAGCDANYSESPPRLAYGHADTARCILQVDVQSERCEPRARYAADTVDCLCRKRGQRCYPRSFRDRSLGGVIHQPCA